MMFAGLSGLFSFLGGTAFRWLFGEIISFFRARDEHKMEMARMALQHQQDRDRAQWQKEAIKEAADQGIKLIEAQTVASQSKAADEMFLAGILGVNEASKRDDWIGAWNAAIRPALATVAILLLAGQAVAPDYIIIKAMTMEVICAVLGLFVGGRIHSRDPK